MNWNDKQQVLEAVKQNGWALQFASEELRADIDVVLAAVEQNGGALKYASPIKKKAREARKIK